jgi:diguanylate cyclase (GGDEF)-like protein/PAS domain S-box-containing protein
MTEKSVRILLIEDDEDDYFLTCDLLKEVSGTNYEVTWISQYRDALEEICSGRYDICLVDYRLGEGTGIDLLRQSTARGNLTPIILLTGQGDTEIDIEATEAGAADYLVKDRIEAQVLERAIRYAIAHSRTLRTLRESENRIRLIVESAKDAIILIDHHGKIISWNQSAEIIYGYSPAEASDLIISDLFPLRYHQAQKKQGIDALMELGLLQNQRKAIEINGLKKGGQEFPIEISFSSWETVEGTFYSGIIRDITDRKQLEEQLTHQALHDPLTNLANRVLFRDRVEHALTKLKRNKTSLSVLFLDLDNFKTINDSLGHVAGDRLLISFSERLQSCLRSSDTAARLSGDEFAVLIEDSKNNETAGLIANKLHDILRLPIVIDGKEVFVSLSIGIAVTKTGDENPEELLRNADVAMYMAKRQGKGRHVIFQTEMHEALMQRIEIEENLRLGIEKEEFSLHYQPIVELTSTRIVGMESLVRWNHPKKGLISPAQFIPIAEDTNLIIPLGTWILEEACRQAQKWQNQYDDRPHLSIAVNLSIRQFQQKDLVETVANALTKSGLPSQRLVLEITENHMLQDTETTIKKLHELKELGVRLAIDDFGTGYSSLSYLQRFPVDIIKIDKSFIDKINHGQEGMALARAIIMMSESLGLRTVAEGIEEAEQAETLRHLGCVYGQGYYFSRPLSKEQMDDFLLKTHPNGRLIYPAPQVSEFSQVQ